VRPVVFVKYFDKGSTVLGGHQMTEALRQRGIESRTIYATELGPVRDSILVFIKKGRLDHLLAARRRNNITVLDVQDTLCFKRRLKNKAFFDGIIFRSQKPLDDYGTGDHRSVKIYLQWNASYRLNHVGDAEFRLAYIGDPRSFSFWNQLPDVPCVPEVDFFEEARKYNCHISIRTAARDVLYKPTCKVSTAAVCGANLITTADEGSLEVLGEDYPFYTDPDPESIQRTIDYARTCFGGPVWTAALKKLQEVRRSHDLQTIVPQYLGFFSRLEGD
jgi:hypothetical protein